MGVEGKSERRTPAEFASTLLSATVSGRALSAAVSGFGGFLAIYLLARLSVSFGVLLLIAPFGASCALVFAVPQSPLAQPRNVIAGHLLSTFIGLLAFSLLGASPLAYALGVGIAIAAMQLSGTMHPPAGADPIVVVLAGAGWSFLLQPVMAGAVSIVLIGVLYHKAISKRQYPLRGVEQGSPRSV